MLPCVRMSLDAVYLHARPAETHVSFYMTVSNSILPEKHFELWDLPYSALC